MKRHESNVSGKANSSFSLDFEPYKNEERYRSPAEVSEAIMARGRAAVQLFSLEGA